MTDQNPKDKLREFYKEIVLALVAAVRSLSLYPPEHPESEKKLKSLFKRLDLYLSQHPTLTLLLLSQEVIVENMPFPELTDLLPKLLQRLEAIHLERLMFRQGLSEEELITFLQLLVPLLQDPKDGEIVLARNQESSPTFWQAAFLWNPSLKFLMSSLWMCSNSPVNPCSLFLRSSRSFSATWRDPCPVTRFHWPKGL